MKISQLFQDLESEVTIFGNSEFDVKQVTAQSQKVKADSLFVAMRGERVDGAQFIEEAIRSGAKVIVSHEPPRSYKQGSLVWIQCGEPGQIFPEIMRRFFGDPASRLQLLGVTGTNGKTTTIYLLRHLLNIHEKTLLVGTIEYCLGRQSLPAPNTTPGVEKLTELMAEAVRWQFKVGVFEVSSHALKQDRVRGLKFDVGIFSNLTHDHLDYHGTLEEYYHAKRKLFMENNPKISIVNIDDAYGNRLHKELVTLGRKILSFSAQEKADSFATEIELGLGHTRFQWHYRDRTYPVKTFLVGRHNVYNALSALTAVCEVGILPEEAVRRIQIFPGVPGRMERVEEQLPFFCFVDYAHTPDALERVLSSVRELLSEREGKLIVVVGCGGDRDPAKRPLMGSLADRYSDHLIVTSDNPRTEDPEKIIDEVLQGFSGSSFRIRDRKLAIEEALQLAGPGDSVVILGKGHEDYQIVGEQKIYFSDQEVVRGWAKANRRAGHLESGVS